MKTFIATTKNQYVQDVTLKAGTYTFQAYVKGDKFSIGFADATDFASNIWTNINLNWQVTASDYQYVKETFTLSKPMTKFSLMNSMPNTETVIVAPMLEEGNNASTIKPNDLDDKEYAQNYTDAAIVKATFWSVYMSSPVIYKDAKDASTSGVHSTTTLKGEWRSGNTVTYGGYITITPNGGTEPTTATASPVTFTPADTDGKTSYTVKLYDTAAKTTLLDTQTIPVVFKGASGINAINVVLTNEADVLPADSSGNMLDYSGSGTSILVYEGATTLSYTTASPLTTNGTFNVSATGTNVTPSAKPTGSTCDYGMVSNMTADKANISFTINGLTSNGTPFTITKIQSLSMSRKGAKGDDSVTYWSTPSALQFKAMLDGSNYISPNYDMQTWLVNLHASINGVELSPDVVQASNVSYPNLTADFDLDYSGTGSPLGAGYVRFANDALYGQTDRGDISITCTFNSGQYSHTFIVPWQMVLDGDNAVSYKLVPSVENAIVTKGTTDWDISATLRYKIQKSVGKTITYLSALESNMVMTAQLQTSPVTNLTVTNNSGTFVASYNVLNGYKSTTAFEQIIVRLYDSVSGNNYDARIINVQFKSDVNFNIDTKLGTITSDISNANGEISSIKQDITSIQTDVEGKASISDITQTQGQITLEVARRKGNLAWYSGFEPLADSGARPNSGVDNMAAGYYTIDKSVVKYPGVNSLKIQVTGLSADSWVGYWGALNIAVQPDTQYTFSFWGYTDSLASLESRPAYFEIKTFDSSGTVITTNYSYSEATPSADGTWQFFSKTFTTPATAVKISVFVGLTRNGRIWITCPNLIVGDQYDSGYLLANGESLLPTGINVQEGKIDMAANDFTLRNNSGDVTMGVDAQGNVLVTGTVKAINFYQNVDIITRYDSLGELTTGVTYDVGNYNIDRKQSTADIIIVSGDFFNPDVSFTKSIYLSLPDADLDRWRGKRVQIINNAFLTAEDNIHYSLSGFYLQPTYSGEESYTPYIYDMELNLGTSGAVRTHWSLFDFVSQVFRSVTLVSMPFDSNSSSAPRWSWCIVEKEVRNSNEYYPLT